MKSGFLIKSVLFVLTNLLLCSAHAQNLEDIQREYTDLRFGAFFHFGIRTFTGGDWGEANQDVTAFNPIDLDCGQWADALVAANMKFGILTTKHHDGFCLWDSEYTENDVASSPWKNGEGDVIREYVDSFRARGLEPSLYYSIWDNTAGIGNGAITEDDMEVIRGQLTEILSNYGEIGLLFIDGWSWKMGHVSVPYDEIHALVRELQPNCLLIDNTHLPCLYHNDMLHYEAGGEIPHGNTQPSLLSLLIYTSGGNSWFWDEDIPTANLLSKNSIVNTLSILEPQWVTFVLNTPPNNSGLLDDNIVSRLHEVGDSWSPNTSRASLPDQAPQIIEPITPVSATATSGNANNAIDGINDRYYYSVWQTTGSLPQSITIDLGEIYEDVSTLQYVPKYVPYISPLKEGSIKSFSISASTDNNDFTEVLRGEWNGDVNMKAAVFEPVQARYIRLEALTAIDNFAAATEIAIGKGIYYDPTENLTLLTTAELNFNAYPNPTLQSTTISYSLDEPALVTLSIFDLYGRKLETLLSAYQTSDEYSLTYNSLHLPEGIYWIELKINEQKVVNRKLIISSI